MSLLLCVGSLNTIETPLNSSSPNPRYEYCNVQNQNLANPYSEKQPASLTLVWLVQVPASHSCTSSGHQLLPYASLGEQDRPQVGLSLYWSVQTLPLTPKQRKDYKKRMYTALIQTGSSCGRLFFSKINQSNIAIRWPLCKPVPALLPWRYFDGNFSMSHFDFQVTFAA